MNRTTESTFDSPAPIKAAAEATCRKSDMSFPLSHSHGQTVVGQEMTCSPIIGLFCPSGPLAVALLIGAVVINAVYAGSLKGNIAHVFVERDKGFSPTATDGNPSASISHIALSSRVVATTQHLAPNTIDEGTSHAMGYRLTSKNFCSVTPATNSMARADVAMVNQIQGATVTSTYPSPMYPFGFTFSEDEESSVSFSGEIHLARLGGNDYHVGRHTFSPYQETMLEQPIQPQTGLAVRIYTRTQLATQVFYRKVA